MANIMTKFGFSLACHFHGLPSSICVHRNPSVSLEPENMVPSGKTWVSMALPKSMRHNPLPFACWKSVSWLKMEKYLQWMKLAIRRYLMDILVGSLNHVSLFGWGTDSSYSTYVMFLSIKLSGLISACSIPHWWRVATAEMISRV